MQVFPQEDTGDLSRHRAGWFNAVALDLYTGESWFKPRPRHGLTSLRFPMSFLSPSRQIPGWYLNHTTTASFRIISYSSAIPYSDFRYWQHRWIDSRRNNDQVGFDVSAQYQFFLCVPAWPSGPLRSVVVAGAARKFVMSRYSSNIFLRRNWTCSVLPDLHLLATLQRSPACCFLSCLPFPNGRRAVALSFMSASETGGDSVIGEIHDIIILYETLSWGWDGRGM